MSLDMVDADDRFAGRISHALGIVDADQQRADQPRPLRDRDAVELTDSDSGPGERRLDHSPDLFQVLARGQFRNHSAVTGMDGDLRSNDVGTNLDAVFDD